MNAAASLDIEYPESKYGVTGPFCCIGGLTSLCIKQLYLLKTGDEKSIGRYVQVSDKELLRYTVSAPGFLFEADSRHEGDLLASFIATMVVIQNVYYNKPKENRFNICSLSLGKFSIPLIFRNCCCPAEEDFDSPTLRNISTNINPSTKIESVRSARSNR